MLGAIPSVKASTAGLKSRRAMLDTLLRHLPMVRLSAGALLMVALSACNGLIDGDGTENLTPEQAAARTAWTQKAYPVLSTQCVGCHAGSEADIAFLSGANPMAVRDSLLNFTVQVVVHLSVAAFFAQ